MSIELQFTIHRKLKIDGKVYEPGPFDEFDPTNETHLRLFEDRFITAEKIEKKATTRRKKTSGTSSK